MKARPGFLFLVPLITGLLSAGAGIISAAGSAAIGLGGAALSTIGSAGGAALTTVGTLGGGAIKTVGTLAFGESSVNPMAVYGAPGVAGPSGGGGLVGVLGGLPAAATTTTNFLGELMPTVFGGIEAYRSITGEEPAGPADYRASGAAPAQPAPTIIQLPALGGQQPLVITPPGPGPAAAEPNYLLYAGIALAAIILLRKK